MSDHSKGRLNYRKEGVAFAIFAGRQWLAKLAGALYDCEGNARRLVACWNAYENSGLTTEQIERGELCPHAKPWGRDQEELLVALRKLLANLPGDKMRGGDIALVVDAKDIAEAQALVAKHTPKVPA